ncbi:unnamed protein product [Eruca vesicaria subsp. sativa]|uniref:Uncharacterized protein n=1 Tax=Eruca vesicaria subsp. sativa TaxID=29727 RepID=A0ABC8L7M7_ERUVS|nr:unnamed protein product [Eruca vesicaria subsp. sativa]
MTSHGGDEFLKFQDSEELQSGREKSKRERNRRMASDNIIKERQVVVLCVSQCHSYGWSWCS